MPLITASGQFRRNIKFIIARPINKLEMGRILIVDDEANIRDCIAVALQRKGHETFQAENTSAGLSLALQHVPDIIISDICMEGGDGFGFLQTVRSDPRTGSIPFIIITGHPDWEGMLRGCENAADGYLPKPVSMNSLVVSVENRLKREESVRRDAIEIKAQLHRVLQASPDLIAIVDPKSLLITFLNSAGTRILETSDVPAQPLTSYFPQSNAESFRRYAIPIALESGQWLGESVFVLASGKRVPVEIVLQAHRHHDGKVEYLSVIGRDLSERIQNEHALRASEYRFRCLVDALPDGVLINNKEGQITFCNAQAVELLGYSEKELLNSPVSSLFRGSPPQRSHRETAFLQQGQTASESNVFRRGGDPVPVSVFRGELEIEGEHSELCIIHNLTERKRIERERALFEVQLRQAQKLESIGQLAAGIAHEINTPTQYIGDNTRFTKDAFASVKQILNLYQEFVQTAATGSISGDQITQINEAVEKLDLPFLLQEIPSALDQSLEGIERVSRIVRAMKDFSHPNCTEKAHIDVNNAIESTLLVARNEWKYVANLETHFDRTIPPVPCLPGEFNQVILNLIVNAAHAITDVIGDGDEKGTIRIATTLKSEMIEISIADTGSGIPESIRGKIFEPFFTTKEVGKGTGQGLAIARSVIVDKHNGTIDFESQQGKGTTFTIRLPLKAAE